MFAVTIKRNILTKVVALAVVFAYLGNNIVWAESPRTYTNLATGSRLKPFFEEHGLSFMNLYAVATAAAQLREFNNTSGIRESHIMNLNKLFSSEEVFIEPNIRERKLSATQRPYNYVTLYFGKGKKPIEVRLVKDYESLTEDELLELGVRTEKDKEYFSSSQLADVLPKLSGVWFVDPERTEGQGRREKGQERPGQIFGIQQFFGREPRKPPPPILLGTEGVEAGILDRYCVLFLSLTKEIFGENELVLLRRLSAYREVREKYIDSVEKVIGMKIDDPRLLEMAGRENWVRVILGVALSLIISAQHVKRNNIAPTYYAGHSLGFFTALLASGALDFEEGLIFSKALLPHIEEVAKELGIYHVKLLAGQEVDLQAVIAERFPEAHVRTVYARNKLSVIGKKDYIETLANQLWEENVLLRRPQLVQVHAMHSPYLRQRSATLDKLVTDLRIMPPSVPIVSEISGKILSSAEAVRNDITENMYGSLNMPSLITTLIHSDVRAIVSFRKTDLFQEILRAVPERFDFFTLGYESEGRDASPPSASAFLMAGGAGATLADNIFMFAFTWLYLSSQKASIVEFLQTKSSLGRWYSPIARLVVTLARYVLFDMSSFAVTRYIARSLVNAKFGLTIESVNLDDSGDKDPKSSTVFPKIPDKDRPGEKLTLHTVLYNIGVLSSSQRKMKIIPDNVEKCYTALEGTTKLNSLRCFLGSIARWNVPMIGVELEGLEDIVDRWSTLKDYPKDTSMRFIVDAIRPYVEKALHRIAENAGYGAKRKKMSGDSPEEIPGLGDFKDWALVAVRPLSYMFTATYMGKDYFIKINRDAGLGERESRIVRELYEDEVLRDYIPEEVYIFQIDDGALFEISSAYRRGDKEGGDIYDYIHSGMPCVVMSGAPGVSVSEDIKNLAKAELDEEFKVSIVSGRLKRLTEALSVLHENGVYHRDVDEDEISIDIKRGRITFMNFNIAVTPGNGMESLKALGNDRGGKYSRMRGWEKEKRDVHGMACIAAMYGCILDKNSETRRGFEGLPLFVEEKERFGANQLRKMMDDVLSISMTVGKNNEISPPSVGSTEGDVNEARLRAYADLENARADIEQAADMIVEGAAQRGQVENKAQVEEEGDKVEGEVPGSGPGRHQIKPVPGPDVSGEAELSIVSPELEVEVQVETEVSGSGDWVLESREEAEFSTLSEEERIIEIMKQSRILGKSGYCLMVSVMLARNLKDHGFDAWVMASHGSRYSMRNENNQDIVHFWVETPEYVFDAFPEGLGAGPIRMSVRQYETGGCVIIRKGKPVPRIYVGSRPANFLDIGAYSISNSHVLFSSAVRDIILAHDPGALRRTINLASDVAAEKGAMDRSGIIDVYEELKSVQEKSELIVGSTEFLKEDIKNEARQIHAENLKFTPTISKGKILCHIIADSVLPSEQMNLLKADLEKDMRGTEYKEKIVALSVSLVSGKAGHDEFIAELEKVKKKVCDNNRGYDVEFTVASPDIEGLVERLQSEGVKALAFRKQGDGSIVQVEGILLALRVLRTENIDKLLHVYKFLTGEDVVEIPKNINELARKLIFTMPVRKVGMNEDSEINKLIHENILTAA
ncbi:MAG: hypothetical protein P9L88_00080 [Candidatus Tantalella remota]|nr:hypothetical protein [Candidatus Tantalella remota]